MSCVDPKNQNRRNKNSDQYLSRTRSKEDTGTTAIVNVTAAAATVTSPVGGAGGGVQRHTEHGEELVTYALKENISYGQASNQ